MPAHLSHVVNDSPALISRIHAALISGTAQLGHPLGAHEIAQMEDIPLSDAKVAMSKLLSLGRVIRIPGTEDFLPQRLSA